MSDKRFFGSVSAGAVIEWQWLQESFILGCNERMPLQDRCVFWVGSLKAGVWKSAHFVSVWSGFGSCRVV